MKSVVEPFGSMCVKVRYVHCGRESCLVVIAVAAGGVGRHGCKSLCLCLVLLVVVALLRRWFEWVWWTVLRQHSAEDCFDDSNLVDSASSHTLVSKIKPCMCKYKSCTLKLRTAHYISDSLFDNLLLLG